MTPVNIPGYCISEELYHGSRTLVYRGYREQDSLPVVVKLLKNPYPSFSELVQFRNQYTIAKNLNYPGIIQTYSLEPYQNGYVLVMEDFGGISLSNWRRRWRDSVNLREFFQIAIALADTLDILYKERVIHKDIKPSNILINPETKQIKLIDFSIASLLPRETQAIISPNILEGTLAYISPEQTGRMNRLIDYRTDYYSLGVTLYELLTGELPFQSEDAMELVHSHIAKIPRELGNQEGIPETLSDIVMKLMAKNAEDRYQSAWGLKSDLEKCLHQLTEIGEISNFEIAQNDVSDRFIIPDQLYGRETEVEILLQAFERVSQGTTEMMLVAGFSGIGKTAVINEVHKPIVQQRGYFIKGKYDQFNRNIPLSAFVKSFRDLMGQLLTENETQIQKWKSRILEAVGESGQVIIEVIPELEQIIGKQPPAPKLSVNATQNRFNSLFQKFVQIFTTQEHPLVMFLDDLQWADAASLKLLQLLIQDTGHLLILGAYRDNEVSPVHPFILTVDEIIKTGAKVNVITLSPLSETEMNTLVADTLNCEASLAHPLTELIYQKTQGNPFFATQFLKALHDDKLIKFNWDIQHWQCDIAHVKALTLSDDVVEFTALQLQKLPFQTQEILKIAACIGTEFDLNTLVIASEKSPLSTATALWKALQEGLLIPTTKIYNFFTQSDSEEVLPNAANPTYRFLHDRIQQAAYSLIPENAKQATHLKIGQLLQHNLSATEKEEKLFDIVGHLNLGQDLITQPQEKEALAQINLAAGLKARNATAYNASKVYLQTGIDLLTSNCWQSQYELTLNLYVAATESAYLNGEIENMQQKAGQVLQFAPTILDKVKIYEIQISALTAQSQMLEAIAVGQNALAQLGIEFSLQPNEALTNKALQTLASQLQDKQIAELINLPEMSDPRTMAAMQLLAMLFGAIFLGNPGLMPLACATMISLSLELGNAPASIIGYAGYGMVLCAFLGEVEKGYSFGRVALNLLNQLNAREFKSLTLLWFGCFIQQRQEALRAIIPTLKEGYLAGMETGNFLHAGFNIVNHFSSNFFAGVPLDDWEPEIENYCTVFAQAKQDSHLIYLKMPQQTVHNLREIVDAPDLLNGTAYNETVMIPKHHQDNELTAIACVYIYKLMLAYLFGNYTNALEYIAQAQLYLMAVGGLIFTQLFHFYAGLTYLALFSSQSEIEPANTLTLVETHQTPLAQWAHHAPMNYQHKFDLVEAEKCRVLGKNHEAGDWYDRAISKAKENAYTQEEALANELAAKFYLDRGKEKIAQLYMQEAYYCYARWGAKAKTGDLEKRYPQLLKPILQQRHLNLNTLETFAFRGTSSLTPTSSIGSTSISDALDFTSVLKAAQIISRSIELDELLTNLSKIILENSGAKKAVLILPQKETWQIRAITIINHQHNFYNQIQTILESQSLDTCKDVPRKIINYIKNTQKTVIIDNCQTSIPGLIGEYMLENQPKSILCTPMINQGHLLGILYLENKLTSGVFTKERLEVIKLLSTQAAISLENARLYQQVQQALQDSLLKQISIDRASIAVWWIEKDARIFYVNDAACKDLGYLREEMIGKYVFDFDAVFSRELWAEHWQTICEQVSFTIESYHRHKTGKIYPVEITVNYVEFNGKVYNFAFAKNISERQAALQERKQAEAAIQQKSQELEKALQDLQQAQLQIVQNEKMSALGNLVAGVAHEMNNPLGFISASLQQAKPMMNDIVEHLKLYQESLTNPSDEIQDHAAEIDLEYSLEDLPKMIDGMAIACDRLRNISTSLRTFSRADKDYKVPFNIHEGIDSTILILKHRLKANEARPAIEVSTEYGNLPKVECFPGQLNQVFMNIIANAIDALDEFNIGRNVEEIRANPNKIIIKTSVEDNDVKITIADNANGMSEDIKQKIFDHLFTTKAVGKGTGLGLAIARQIIVEKHGGKIEVDSKQGEGTAFIITFPILAQIETQHEY